MNPDNVLQILESLVEATSGGLAAACSMGILYPLDVLLVRYQAASGGLVLPSVQSVSITISDSGSSTGVILPTPRTSVSLHQSNVHDIIAKTIQEKGGILKAMYGGLEVKLFETVVRNFVYFYWYRTMKFLWEDRVGPTSTTSSLLIATAAAILNHSMTAPLELISTRLQTSNISAGSSMKQIFDESGLKGFYRGFGAGLILCINPAITTATFDRMKYLLQLLLLASLRRDLGILSLNSQRPSASDPELPELTALQSFILGAIAKSIATLITYPIIRSKILLQSSQVRKDRQRKSSKISQSVALDHGQKLIPSPSTPVHHPSSSSNRSNDPLHLNRSYSRFFRAASFCISDSNSLLKEPFSALTTTSHQPPAGNNTNDGKCSNTQEPITKSLKQQLLDLNWIPNELPANEKGVLGVILTTILNEGVSGLYHGLLLQLFKTVLASALLYMIKEKIHKDVKKVFFFTAFYMLRLFRQSYKKRLL